MHTKMLGVIVGIVAAMFSFAAIVVLAVGRTAAPYVFAGLFLAVLTAICLFLDNQKGGRC